MNRNVDIEDILYALKSIDEKLREKILRDEFAMAALRSISMATFMDDTEQEIYKLVATRVYRMADAMMNARGKKNDEPNP